MNPYKEINTSTQWRSSNSSTEQLISTRATPSIATNASLYEDIDCCWHGSRVGRADTIGGSPPEPLQLQLPARHEWRVESLESLPSALANLSVHSAVKGVPGFPDFPDCWTGEEGGGRRTVERACSRGNGALMQNTKGTSNSKGGSTFVVRRAAVNRVVIQSYRRQRTNRLLTRWMIERLERNLEKVHIE